MTASTSSSIFTLAPTAGGAAIVGTVSLSGTTATFTPSSSLTADTLYTATVTTGVKDAAGIALAANKTWSFRTAAAVVGGADSGSYLFYRGRGSSVDENLAAVDPATITPIAVEAGGDVPFASEYFAITAAYDTATKSISNVRTYAVVYEKTDNKLYKVNALKSAGTPMPVQLSSETAYGGFDTIAYDLANPEDTQIVYSVSPGAYKMVRLGMSPTEAPIVAKKPIAEIHDWSTGAISGWLVSDSGALKRCDKNFSNCGAPLRSIGSQNYGSRWADSGNRSHMLFSIGDAMFVYNYGTGAVSPSIGNGSRGYSDGDKFYFRSTSPSRTVYSAPVDGSAPATTLLTDYNSVYFTANAELAVLGAIPSDMGNFRCDDDKYSSQLLCSGSADTSFNSDILYMNSETADSVARVTATPSINEYPFTY